MALGKLVHSSIKFFLFIVYIFFPIMFCWNKIWQVYIIVNIHNFFITQAMQMFFELTKIEY
jgi:hypothetical protein